MSDLTPEQRVRRAERAKAAYDEFVKPELDFMEEHYTKRIVEVATTELDSKKRSDKIANLSVALRIGAEMRKGFEIVAHDGKEAESRLIRAETIENFTPAKRRLLNIGAY